MPSNPGLCPYCAAMIDGSKDVDRKMVGRADGARMWAVVCASCRKVLGTIATPDNQ